MFSSNVLRRLNNIFLQIKLVSGNVTRNLNAKDGNNFCSSASSSGFDKENYTPRRLRAKKNNQKVVTPKPQVTNNQHELGPQEQKFKDMLGEMVTVSENIEQFPSDISSQSNVVKRVVTDPETTSITLFPGQGSQFVGMGKQLLHYPGVKEIYDHASEILKYDLLHLCLHGPKSELDKTVYCQPAVFVTSVAAIERLKEENFQGIESTVATAGLSVGEYAAMVFAEMISFEDALNVVKIRAQEMQKASEETPSGMMTVFCFHGTKLSLALQAAKEHCISKHNISHPICEVANYLFPEVKVLAGHEEALAFIARHYKDFGIRAIKRLPVSGAFHTSLMNSAVKPVRDALNRIEINRPRFPVYSNVTFKRMNKNEAFHKNMMNQIIKPVKWEQILGKFYKRDKEAKFPYTYECGPGRQLGIFLEKLNLKAFENYRNIKV